MNKYYIFWTWILIIQLFIRMESVAQINRCKYYVEGRVYDLKTDEPLPFATIQVVGTTKGTVADENGYFYLNSICEEEFDLEFSHIGYKKVVHHHDVHHKLPRIYLAPDNVTLQSVIIEGETQPGDQLTGTVSRISAEELRRHHGENLGDITGRIAGVSVIRSGQNVVKPVIHGLHSNRILIINNGVRHEFQNWGSEHAPEIDPSMADNIQVIKGAATVRYGPDALGGVILITPSRMEFLDPLNGHISGAFSSNGRAGEGSFRIKNGFHKVALLAEGALVRQGDMHAPDYQLTNTGKKESSISLGARYHTKKLDFTARYSRFDQELGILRGSVTGNLDDLANAIESDQPEGTAPFSYAINNPKQVATHEMLRINMELAQPNSLLNIQYAFQNNHRQEFDVRRGTNNDRPSINLQMATHTIDTDWKHPELNNWIGTIGIQALYQDNNNIFGTNTIPFIPNYNNYRIGAFIIESKELSSITLEWGLRYDYQYSSIRSSQPAHQSEPVFQNVSATGGIKKYFKSGNYLLSTIGSAWRPPSISELYAFGKHQNAIEYGLQRYDFDEDGFINADVMLDESQKPIQSEKGLKWINTYHIDKVKMEAEITGYVNYIDNFIYTRPAGITTTTRGAFPFFIYDQTNAVLTGMDISTFFDHNDKFESYFNGSYLYARNIGDGSYFIGMPPVSMRYTLIYKRKEWLGFSNTQMGMELEYTFTQFQKPRLLNINEILQAKSEGKELFGENDEIFDFVAPPSGYLLADIFLTAELKKWDFQVKLQNLLNINYRTYTDRMRYFADETGLNLKVSVSYKF